MRTRASSHGAAAAELATYQWAQRHSGTTAEWFQQAVRDIVKHVEGGQAPFLQTVRLEGSSSSGSGGGPPAFNTFGVQESVVAAPEVRSRLPLPPCAPCCLLPLLLLILVCMCGWCAAPGIAHLGCGLQPRRTLLPANRPLASNPPSPHMPARSSGRASRST